MPSFIIPDVVPLRGEDRDTHILMTRTDDYFMGRLEGAHLTTYWRAIQRLARRSVRGDWDTSDVLNAYYTDRCERVHNNTLTRPDWFDRDVYDAIWASPYVPIMPNRATRRAVRIAEVLENATAAAQNADDSFVSLRNAADRLSATLPYQRYGLSLSESSIPPHQTTSTHSVSSYVGTRVRALSNRFDRTVRVGSWGTVIGVSDWDSGLRVRWDSYVYPDAVPTAGYHSLDRSEICLANEAYAYGHIANIGLLDGTIVFGWTREAGTRRGTLGVVTTDQAHRDGGVVVRWDSDGETTACPVRCLQAGCVPPSHVPLIRRPPEPDPEPNPVYDELPDWEQELAWEDDPF